MSNNTSKILANFIVNTQDCGHLYDIIVPAVADCFGCIIAGAKSEVSKKVARTLCRFGKGNTRVYGSKLSLSLPYAALLNATAGHSWDLDDYEEPGNTHLSVVLLPAMLATGSIVRCSGKDFLDAYAIGSEVIMRLGEAITLQHYARGFHSTATLGALGVAAATSRLLALSEEQASHSLALSISQAIGYTKQFGSNAKPIQAGLAARAGIESTLLAKNGVTANLDIINDWRGFSGLLGSHCENRFLKLEKCLGNPWAIEEYGLILKSWPSCGYTHRMMTNAIELRDKLGTNFDDIVLIKASLPKFHFDILPFKDPKDRNQALFSLPACTAQALVKGTLSLKHSETKFWEEPKIQQLMKIMRVDTKIPKNPTKNYDPEEPDILTLVKASGEEIKNYCAYPLGAPQNPMNMKQLSEKFNSITGEPISNFFALLKWPDSSDASAFFNSHSNH